MKRRLIEQTMILLSLFLFGVIYRLLDYPANFSPMAAIAMFTGYYFIDKRLLLLPVLIMLLTDLFIGFYNISIMLSVYFSFLAIVLIGRYLKQRYSINNLIFGSVASSTLFFLVTNFSVWYFGNWYSADINGLTKCFTMAIPFFRNTMLGDLFFSGLLFGAYELYRLVAANKIGIIKLNLKNYE